MVHVGGDVYVVLRDDGALCSVHATWDGAKSKCVWLEKTSGEDTIGYTGKVVKGHKYSIVHRILGH